MPRIRGIRRLFRFPFSEDRVSGDVDAEISFHVEARTQELIARGLNHAEARATAMREFGDVSEARAELETIGRRRVRHINRVNWWGDLAQDLKYGLRSLIGAPLFSLLAIATLALGIGANAAVFSVLKSVLLDALPYAEPDRLVRVYARWLDGSAERGPLAAGTIADAAQRQRSFERISAHSLGVANGVLGDESGSRIATIGWVEPSFFDTLGVPAARGRTFRKDDATSGTVPLTGGQIGPDTASNVMLTHAAWQRLFAGDPGMLGRDVRINGQPRKVIGILPPRFTGPFGDVDFYFAFDLAPVVSHPVMGRASQWLGVIARLRPGVGEEDARRELDAIGRELAREHPRDNAAFGLAAMPLREWMVGDTRTPLLVLMTSAALVLLIACANLTGALLSRTLSRRKELAVRVALGAGRGRLVRQLLTESVMLAMVGGVAGVGLAWLMLSSARTLARTMLPDYATLSMDGEVMAVSALLALVTGLAFGTAPALTADRTDPQDVLRSESRGASEGRRASRMRGALVACQIALCVSLLAGAGLLARSLWAMTTAPMGFDPDGVFTASFQLPVREYPKLADKVRFLDELTERLRALPGVQLAAHVGEVPTRLGSRVGFAIDGAPRRANDVSPFVFFAPVSEDYFRLLRIPIRQGRTFDANNREGAPLTVVISETMARRFWPRGEALGARISDGAESECAAARSDWDRRRRAQRSRADRCGADAVSIEPSGGVAARVDSAAHDRRSDDAAEAGRARAGGGRARDRVRAGDDAAGVDWGGDRAAADAGDADDSVRRAGADAGVDWRICDVRQHRGSAGTRVRVADGARVAAASDCRLAAAAGSWVDDGGTGGWLVWRGDRGAAAAGAALRSAAVRSDCARRGGRHSAVFSGARAAGATAARDAG
jgi:predicted permease